MEFAVYNGGMTRPDQIDAFRQVLGPKGVTTDSESITPWLTDWRGRYHGSSPAILSPATTHEVAAVVRLARSHRIPLVPQGGNTSMVGGATPPPDGSALILSMRRMNAIRSVDAAAGQTVCEAGVILSTLHDAAEAAGMRFPLSLGAKGSATIGGLISTNAGGTQVLRHGTMRGLVAGLEAVLPNGEIYDNLAPLQKDNRGYDLKQLLIGAEGTLGVVTAATLTLAPPMTASATIWAGARTPRAALMLLRRLQREFGPVVEAFEIMAGDCLTHVAAHIPDVRIPVSPAVPWHVLITIDLSNMSGGRENPVEQVLNDVMTADASEVMDAVVAQNEAQIASFWRIREAISEAERAHGPALQYDISVPVETMPDFMVDAANAAEARFPGTTASSFGHLGDGNVHFHVRAPAGTSNGPAWITTNSAEISRFVHDLVIAANGSISAEHGIGQMKLCELGRLASPARLFALRAIKTALDPDNIMNPGKLIPLASDG